MSWPQCVTKTGKVILEQKTYFYPSLSQTNKMINYEMTEDENLHYFVMHEQIYPTLKLFFFNMKHSKYVEC